MDVQGAPLAQDALAGQGHRHQIRLAVTVHVVQPQQGRASTLLPPTEHQRQRVLFLEGEREGVLAIGIEGGFAFQAPWNGIEGTVGVLGIHVEVILVPEDQVEA